MKFAEREALLATTDSVDEASETLDLLLRAATHVRMRLSDFLGQYSLTEVRYSVLATLRVAAQAGLSQAELAERLMQSESNISTLIERMQQEGFVDRLRSDADRRKRVLFLSPSGQRLLDRVNAGKRAWADRLMSGLPADNRSTFRMLVKQLGESFYGNAVSKSSSSVTIQNEATLTHKELHWAECHLDDGDQLHSPHLALRQMLSALSLNSQLAEDEA